MGSCLQHDKRHLGLSVFQIPTGLDASNEPHEESLTKEPLTPVSTLPVEEKENALIDLSENSEGPESLPDDADTSVVFQDHPDMEPTEEYGSDDLKQIKGIGPAIEKTLNDLGIYLFSQIADISEYEIDRIAQRLKGFRSRIYREDWLGQARELQYQKSQ